MRRAAERENNLPTGLFFWPEFLSPLEENDLLQFVRGLDLHTFQMHGVTTKRRIGQFGWHYAFESYQLTPAGPIPDKFAIIAARSAALAGIDVSEWAEALVTEYPLGAGIGWHRDAPGFGIVAGISLNGACRMRFRTGAGPTLMTSAIELPPRSMYLLTGDARTKWQHMIPPAREHRYSITFRTLKKRRTGPYSITEP
jgi:DNA oxidative demethylase